MTPIIIQLVTGFSAVVIALIGAIYRLFSSTIDLKMEALKSDLNSQLSNLKKEIEHCRNDRKFLESIIQNHITNKKQETDF